jgi:uncharacterized protein DUF3987
MNTIQDILSRLERVKKTRDGWQASCPCPGHGKGRGDLHPSLSIAVEAGVDNCTGATIQKIVTYCHGGCENPDIMAAIGLGMPNLFPTPHGPPERRSVPRKRTRKGKAYPTPDDAVAATYSGRGEPSCRWDYTDESGEPVGCVMRWDTSDGGKEIRPVSKCPDGWRCCAMPAPRPLYRLTFLPDAEQVCVTEGEKAADAMAALGLVATTCAGGCKAVKQTDWTPLAGKSVVIFPDNDAPGRGYAEDVAEILRGLNPRPTVRFIDPGPAGLNLPATGDAVEYVERLRADGLDADGIRADLEGRVADLRVDLAEAPTRPEPVPPYRPFPVDVLPDIVGDYVMAGAEGIDCAPALIALPMLSAIAAAIGTTRKLDVNGEWDEYPILWTCVVAESGGSKTPARNWALAPVEKLEMRAAKDNEAAANEHARSMLDYKRALKQWERATGNDMPMPEEPEALPVLEYVLDDTTIEALAGVLRDNPRGVLVAPDELAQWFKSYDQYKSRGGADRAKWLKLNTAGLLKVNRKGDGVTIVARAAASITGGIQTGVLRGILGMKEKDSGLAARFLFALPDRKPKRVRRVSHVPGIGGSMRAMFEHLYDLKHDTDADGELRAVEVSLDADAERVLHDYMNAHNRLGEDCKGHVASAWSKLEGYAARLALTIHFARWACAASGVTHDRVDLQSVEAGIALAEWFRYEMQRVYAILDESEAEEWRRGLVARIQKLQAETGEPIAVRQIGQVKAFRPATKVEQALEDLAEMGYGQWEQSRTGARGPRTKRFRLFPRRRIETA